MTEVISIASEKVTEIDEEIETEVSESEGDVDDTVGGVLSVVELSVESPTSSFFLAQERKMDSIKRFINRIIFI